MNGRLCSYFYSKTLSPYPKSNHWRFARRAKKEHDSYRINVTIGGIVDRPVLTNGKPENHEHICLMLSFDHDIVDGAPAARFIRHLKKQIESAEI